MVSKTLYDILEVSSTASPETIRAAYERLSANFRKDGAEPDAELRSMAITEAFQTLSDPAKRAYYDNRLTSRAQPVVPDFEEVVPFWTMPKLAVLALVVVVGSSYYYKYKKEEARLEAEKVIAIAKAKEAEAKARAEAEQARYELERQREQAQQEERQRRERDVALRQFTYEQQRNQVMSNSGAAARAAQERIAQDRQRREEAQAAAAVRQRLAQEKAELCRLERERYGRAISCN